MDSQALITLIRTHQWIALAAILIGFVVRILKSDTPLPTLPPKWRPWAALGLGLVAGVLAKVADGTTWAEAILGGLLAGATAIVGHDTLIESLRDGREIGTPKIPETPQS